MEKMAIDLLWLRPGGVGGTESYIRNLLDGWMNLPDRFDFTLLVSKDNAETFDKYESDKRFHLLVADVNSKGIAHRIIWQNLHQNRFLRKNGFTRCFEPVYCKPWFNGKIQYTCVIHDLQVYHYPQYHPLHEVLYSKLCWQMDAWNAKKIIAISNWVKADIEKRYHRKDVEVIYNPILIKKNHLVDFAVLRDRYGIEEKQFFYTVSQMIPHKNLITLIKVMKKIKEQEKDLPSKLLISGISGNASGELIHEIEQCGLKENVILTGYIQEEERNSLYKNCHSFLFPSVFEGFGMPPVEAMLFGTKVITTKCTSIPEVTQNRALYVENPYSVDEWIKMIRSKEKIGNLDFGIYDPNKIAKKYLSALYNS